MLIDITESDISKAFSKIEKYGFADIYIDLTKNHHIIANMLSNLHDKISEAEDNDLLKKEQFMLYGFILSWCIFTSYLESEKWN